MRWGFTGLLAWDYVCRLAVSLGDGCLVFRNGGREIVARLIEEFQSGGKIPADFPDELYGWAAGRQPGGGAFNSASAARLLVPSAHITYMDAGWYDDRIAAELALHAIDYKAACLRCNPHNVVFGTREDGDKGVLRRVAPPADPPGPALAEGLAALKACDALLTNSVKDREVMTPLASAAAHGKLRMYAMLTPSLHSGYTMESVVPFARAVMLGLDEAERTTGIATPRTLRGALFTTRILFQMTAQGCVFMTMGAAGMLATDPENGCVWRVRLRGNAAAEVSALVHDQPYAVCGCGDWAAGGVFAAMESGVTLVGGGGLAHADMARAAMAGTAAALWRLGYSARLTGRDFDVEEFDLYDRGFGEAA